jgi:hypothetical protein
MRIRAFLTGIAAPLLATGTAVTTAMALDYRPQYDTRPWEAAEPPPDPSATLPQPRPRGVDIPSQYRGTWCATKWSTIYRRCPEPDEEGTPIIDKRSFSWGETGECIPLAITARNGELRVRAACNDNEQGIKAYRTTQFRWRLGTRNQRLQILDYVPVEGR